VNFSNALKEEMESGDWRQLPTSNSQLPRSENLGVRILLDWKSSGDVTAGGGNR
jgi:hypothetical protein